MELDERNRIDGWWWTQEERAERRMGKRIGMENQTLIRNMEDAIRSHKKL